MYCSLPSVYVSTMHSFPALASADEKVRPTKPRFEIGICLPPSVLDEAQKNKKSTPIPSYPIKSYPIQNNRALKTPRCVSKKFEPNNPTQSPFVKSPDQRGPTLLRIPNSSLMVPRIFAAKRNKDAEGISVL